MYESFTKLALPIRAAYLAAAAATWLVTLGGRTRNGRVVVLCYHNVRPDQATRFERQARLAARRAVPLSAIHEPVRRARRPRVVFTFDDAYANLRTTVAPVMRALGAPWSIYPVSGVMGSTPTWSMPEGHPDRAERTMTPDELRDLAADPLVEVGAHTRTHPALATVADDPALRDELESPREALRAVVGDGASIETLALPHGSFDDRVHRAASSAGYTRVLTLGHMLEPRAERVGGAAVVARFSASPDIWRAEFRLLIDGAYSWLGPLRARVKRWKGSRA